VDAKTFKFTGWQSEKVEGGDPEQVNVVTRFVKLKE
jgi:hypothetical protein